MPIKPSDSFSNVLLLALAGAALVGCPGPMNDDADLPDAPRMRRDGGPEVIPDAYEMDVGPVPDTGPRPDSAVRDGGVDAWRRTDAGPVDPIRVDGFLSEAAWLDARDIPPTAIGTGTWDRVQFDHFYVIRTDTMLYLGFSGTFPNPNNAVVVYLDVDYQVGARGVVLNSTGLSDMTPGIGSVLSNLLVSADGTFLPDYGWGAARLPEAASTGSATIGWRTLSSTGTHPRLGMGRSACSSAACETAIALDALGVAAGAELGFIVRVGDTTALGSFAPGLTVPSDDPGFVSNVGTILAP